jgi:hypothetical protein
MKRDSEVFRPRKRIIWAISTSLIGSDGAALFADAEYRVGNVIVTKLR